MNAIKKKKIVYGQFFTKNSIWLRKHIVDFIVKSDRNILFDPFAGNGDILDAVAKATGIKKKIGMDIDEKLDWKVNDSLKSIPKINNSIIVTNPPYLSNYSASRKKVQGKLKKYFDDTMYDDIYLVALDKMLQNNDYVVAIIPETFINSNYKCKYMLNSVTILEDNPFEDTDTPVLVACFDKEYKSLYDVKVYKNDEYINDLGTLEDMRLRPTNSIKCIFNDTNGWLGVRCVDTTNPKDMLRFDYKNNIDYDWEKGIKQSSRLLTLVNVDVTEKKKSQFIDNCNKVLNNIREKSNDVILSPFKGNMKNGKRRRRLDFYTCRAIMEIAYNMTCDNKYKGVY